MVNRETLKKKIAIFDLDGSLVDSDMYMSKEIIKTFNCLGVSITEEEANIEGKKDKYKLASKYGFSRDELDRTFKKNVKGLYPLDNALRSGNVTLYPETLRVLETLEKNGVVLGLLPRATKESDLIYKVQHLGLEKYFGDRISVVSNSQKTKYNSAVELLKKMQGQEGDVYCIGDRAEDVLVANDLSTNCQLNAKGIYVHRSNFPDANLGKYKMVKTLDEILELVLKN